MFFLKPKSYNPKPKFGFTLIELLVVIFIIGVLIAVILVSLSMSRKKGRDNRRKTDLALLQNAIEMYYADYHQFPANTIADWLDIEDPVAAQGFTTALKNGYLSPIPKDPLGDYHYKYYYEAGHYIFVSDLENDQDPDSKLCIDDFPTDYFPNKSCPENYEYFRAE